MSERHALSRSHRLLMLSLMIVCDRRYYISWYLRAQKFQKDSVTLLPFYLDLYDVSNIKVSV